MFPKLKLHKTNLKLRSYCKESFVPLGFIKVKVEDLNEIKVLNIYVVKYDKDPLLGREWINQLKTLNKRTAPYHPATNGLAERFVQTLKRALRKLKIANGNIKANLQKFLYHYRLTPHPELNKSPAEAMYGRKLRSRLDLMFPKINKNNEIIENFGKANNFKKGEKVVVREYLNKNNKWRFGNVITRLGKLHYKVKLEDGRICKCHINQIKGIGSQISNKIHFDDVDHNGPIEITKDIVTPENYAEIELGQDNFDSGSSRDCSEDTAVSESEEGGIAKKPMFHTHQSLQKPMIASVNQL
nr:PREDICTED: uncharacterized protein LOC105677293 [Linepithema humile]